MKNSSESFKRDVDVKIFDTRENDITIERYIGIEQVDEVGIYFLLNGDKIFQRNGSKNWSKTNVLKFGKRHR